MSLQPHERIQRTTVVREGKEYIALNGVTRLDSGYHAIRRRWHKQRNPEQRECGIEGCSNPYNCKGYCHNHYRQIVKPPSCQAEALSKWRTRSPVTDKTWREKRKAEIRRIIAEAKDAPCLDCGGKYEPYQLDFDHTRGEKLFMIHQAIRKPTLSLQRLFDEIAKCDIICANCHRTRTHKRGDC